MVHASLQVQVLSDGDTGVGQVLDVAALGAHGLVVRDDAHVHAVLEERVQHSGQLAVGDGVDGDLGQPSVRKDTCPRSAGT